MRVVHKTKKVTVGVTDRVTDTERIIYGGTLWDWLILPVVQSLSKSDSEDPSKIYCNKVRRNPNNGHRREFNADKTKLLRPSLYTYFSNDESISFCYYSDETMENDDETILKNFSSR